MLDTRDGVGLDTVGRKHARFALGGGTNGHNELLSALTSRVYGAHPTLCIQHVRLITTRLLLVQGHRRHSGVEGRWTRGRHMWGLSVMLWRLRTTTVVAYALCAICSALCTRIDIDTASTALELLVRGLVRAFSSNKGVCERRCWWDSVIAGW